MTVLAVSLIARMPRTPAREGVPRAGDPGPFAPSVLSDGSLEATRLCAGWLLASVLADGRTGGGSLRLDSKYTMPGHGGCAGSVAARSFWPLLARLVLLCCGVKERTLKGKNFGAGLSGSVWRRMGGLGGFPRMKVIMEAQSLCSCGRSTLRHSACATQPRRGFSFVARAGSSPPTGRPNKATGPRGDFCLNAGGVAFGTSCAIAGAAVSALRRAGCSYRSVPWAASGAVVLRECVTRGRAQTPGKKTERVRVECDWSQRRLCELIEG